LIRAYREHPDALVSTTYTAADGPDGRENMTVRELTRTHLEGVEGVGTPCYRRLEKRLRDLLEN
jgi:hypothetical protein